MKRLISIILALAAALWSGAICTGTLCAADAKENSLFISTRTAISDDNIWISSAALTAWRRVVNARADIRAKDLRHAQDELKQAHSMLDAMEAMDPANEIKDRLWIAEKHLAYEDSASALKDLPPIYASLDDMEYLTPVDEPRVHVDRAREYLLKGNNEGATNELRAANSAIFYSEFDLSVTDTRRHVLNAQAFLIKRKVKEADAELKLAEDGVRFLSDINFFPVIQARKSLLLAGRDYAAGKLEATRDDLREARAYLEKEAASSEAEAREAAKSLIKDIEIIEGKIQKFDHDTNQEIQKLYGRAKTLTAQALKRFKREGGDDSTKN